MTRNRAVIARLLPLLLLLALQDHTRADERGAKEIFFSPDNPGSATVASPKIEGGRRVAKTSTTTPSRTIGLSYWIELIDTPDRAGKPVTDRRTFHSGERIRLHFQPNVEGRIVIVQIGSSGTSTVLFPDAAKGAGDNLLHANHDRVLPAATHWFRFDSTAGTETLLVVFAKTQQAIDELVPTKRVIDATTTAAFLRTASSAHGSKDLLIETETETPEEIGRYLISITGKPIMFAIDLHHD